MVECLTRDRGATGSSLTGVTALCPWARHINPSLVLVQPRKTCSYIAESLLMRLKESNQTNKTILRFIPLLCRLLFYKIWCIHTTAYILYARIQMGEKQGVRTPPPPPPPKNHKNIVFFRNTHPDSLKITKLRSQQSMLGNHRGFAAGPMMDRFSGIVVFRPSISSSTLEKNKDKKTKQKKNVGPPLTK